MAWLEVHQGLREHRKLYACADSLDVKPTLMLGMLVSFWLWALDNAQNGKLEGVSNRTIARAAMWPEKRADKLVSALIACGWIDQIDDILVIHDWDEYTGKLMDRREADRERKRKKKEEKRQNASGIPADAPGDSAGVPAEILGSSGEIPVLQYSTVSPDGDTTAPNSTTSVSPDGDTPVAFPVPGGPAIAPIDSRTIQEMYNALCPSLPTCRVLSDARRKAIGARLRAGYGRDDFQTLFMKAEASSFLRGGNKRNWAADFDWLIADANMAKVLDGKYDDRTPASTGQVQTSNPFRQMLQEER